jgi:WD40 repeat protein
MMLLGTSQLLSDGMLCQQGLLRRGEKLLPMSQESERSLWEKYAEPTANLTQRQRRKLMLFRLRAFLLARLLGKQSWQHAGIIVQPDVLRHLMTMDIPRIRISPIRMPESPVKQAWQLRGSVVYDSSGFVYNGMYHDWSQYHYDIKAITSHSNQSLIALMHSDGNVWIGKIGDPDNLFCLIHSSEKEGEKATAIAFHPFSEFIAVATPVKIKVYKLSPSSLKRELHFTVSFYESGSFCPKPRYSADTLDWNSDGTLLTASSSSDLSMVYFLNPVTIKVIGDLFHCGTKFGVIQEDMSPSCSCFSVGGNLVMTGYPNGTLETRRVEKTPKDGLCMMGLQRMNQILPGKIDNIVSYPYNPSVFAIGVSCRWSHSSVLIVLVDHDGSVTIIATIQDAKIPHFHGDWLLVSSGKRILFHHMNSRNIPCLVTEFHLPDNGTMRVEIDAFCVKTSPNGKVMLYYAHDGKSNLCTAEITLS